MQSMKGSKPILATRHSCLGCHACEAVCPTQSISFQGEGFFKMPVIDEQTCIECGRCENVCKKVRSEFLSEEISFEQQFFCAYNTDNNERALASSGGVGGALAELAIKKGWLVCGAAFGEDMSLSHILSDDTDILTRIRGSKYLQSNVTGIYEKIVAAAKQGRQTLFIGTPCQCEALRSVLPAKNSADVLMCAIVCHGVNSQKVWKDYVKSLQQKYKSKLTGYNFRSKDKGWKIGVLRSRISFENKKETIQPAWRDLFMTWFGKHYIQQESCFHCPYRIPQRYADLTIGDFWGVENILPDLPSHNGVSVLVVSSERGKDFALAADKLTLIKVDARLTSEKALRGFVERRDEDLRQKEIKRRLEFEKEYKESGFGKMAQKYAVETYLHHFIYKVRYKLHQFGILK